VPAELVQMTRRHRLVVSLEDGGRHGGFGWALAAALRDAEVDVPLRDLGIPQRFLDHGSREEVLADLGLTAQDVARSVTGWAVGLIGAPEGPLTAEAPGSA
ncbi:MAG TPA: transketolase C-terminal domain-containing protein, partial [Pseudonocardiaceae bacterium]|nr:transketolase C-terminal domain-containing protein [Pseudonocardiaceae bacterium]